MNIKEILDAVRAFEIQSAHDLENFRIHFLGSKGQIKDLYGELKSVPNEEKRLVGQQINDSSRIARDCF
jgi:phenylalanyl-tRNA synthetase alpha chain